MLSETIFNHNPTEKELDGIINCYSERGKRDYFEDISQDVAYFHISILYKWRGNNKKSDEYWNKIRKELRDAAEYEEKESYLTLPSTIDKIPYFETVFDHNLTKKELEKYPLKQRYIIHFQPYQDRLYLDISELYEERAWAAVTKAGYIVRGTMTFSEDPKPLIIYSEDPKGYEVKGYIENMEIAKKYYNMISEEGRKEIEKWK